MGTPDFAVPILKSLAKVKNTEINEESAGYHEVVAVVTQPDRPKGRGHGVQFSPVKQCALEMGLPVLQPTKMRAEGVAEVLKAVGADVFVVVAYGQILPVNILEIPPLGCINIHASLLPKYRGAAPMQRAILNGDTTTGVTIMYMDKGMDTGDMILKKSISIEPTDRFIDVHNKMATLSCECIAEALIQLERGIAPREPQNHDEATYAPMLKKEDGLIDWNSTTLQIINQVRALDPWPGTYTFHEGQVLKIWGCTPVNEINNVTDNIAPGTVLDSKKSEFPLMVATSDGALSITEMQGSGGKRMKTLDYLRGRTIAPGTVFGLKK